MIATVASLLKTRGADDQRRRAGRDAGGGRADPVPRAGGGWPRPSRGSPTRPTRSAPGADRCRRRNRAPPAAVDALLVGPSSDAGRVAALVGLLFGLAGMGSAAVAVTLPAIAADLGLTTGGASWAISLYALMLAVATAVYGRVADLAGIRLPLLVGVGLMTGGAVLGAFAPTFEVLLGARLLQGRGRRRRAHARHGDRERPLRGGRPYRGAGPGRRHGRRGQRAGPAGRRPGRRPRRLAGGRRAAGPRAARRPGAVAGPPDAGHRRPPGRPRRGAGRRHGRRPGAARPVAGRRASSSPPRAPSCSGSGVPAVAARVRRRPEGFLPTAVIHEPVVVRSALAASAVPAAWFALLIAVPAVLAARGLDAAAGRAGAGAERRHRLPRAAAGRAAAGPARAGPLAGRLRRSPPPSRSASPRSGRPSDRRRCWSPPSSS